MYCWVSPSDDTKQGGSVGVLEGRTEIWTGLMGQSQRCEVQKGQMLGPALCPPGMLQACGRSDEKCPRERTWECC